MGRHTIRHFVFWTKNKLQISPKQSWKVDNFLLARPPLFINFRLLSYEELLIFLLATIYWTLQYAKQWAIYMPHMSSVTSIVFLFSLVMKHNIEA